jgi:uncharacterized membrane protein
MGESIVKLAIFMVIFFSILWFAWFLANRTIRLLRSLGTADDNSVSTKEKESARVQHLAMLLLLFSLVPSFLVASFISTFGFWNGYQISGSLSDWGQMGDFFGGMLNPILAFASFIALLVTIKLQSEEMKETREELKQSRIAQQDLVKQAKAEQKNHSNRERYKILLSSMVDSNDRIRNMLQKPFTKVERSDMKGNEKCPADIAYWCSFQDKDSLREAFRGYILDNASLFQLLLDDVKPILSECRRLKVIASDFEAACLDIGILTADQVHIMNPASFEQLVLKDSTLHLQNARWLSKAFDSFTEASFTPAPGSVLDKFSQELN